MTPGYGRLPARGEGRSRRWRLVRDLVVVATLLVVAFLAVRAAGGSRTALPHAFYIPIVVAAVRFGWRGALASALTAGVLCGPLMPLDVATGTPQSVGNWLLRAAFFLAVAGVAAVATGQARRAIAHEHALADERTELAEARTTLLQIVAHELRTPLTVIKGSVPLIVGQIPDGHRVAGLVPAVERATGRLEDLARVVSAAVESPAAPAEPVEAPVSTLLEEAMAGIAAHHGPERVRVSISTARTIVTEPESLRLAVRWLAENALKFSPDDEPVEVSAHDRDGVVDIEIRDHGPGIPDDFTTGSFPILRQGDATTTRERGGLGLGLYATDRLVQRLGGSVTVERAAGGGTIARVTLPAGPADTGAQ